MKIAVLSDIHANAPALKSVLDDCRSKGCDRIYHLGDLVGIGSLPQQCVDLCREAGVVQIMGNHDDLVATGMPAEPPDWMSDSEFQHQHWTHSQLNKSSRDYIRNFPFQIIEEIEGVRIRFVHFELNEDARSFVSMHPTMSDGKICGLYRQGPFDLVLFGHVHRRIYFEIDGIHYHCESSLGCATDSIARYSIATIEQGRFEFENFEILYDDSVFLRRYTELDIPATEEINSLFFKARIRDNRMAGD
jgi:predicted phosphodiesterase